MSEFEDSLRGALRNDATPADESFIERVDARINAHQQGRTLGLALAAAAAIALIAVMGVGVGIAVPELLTLADRSLPALPGKPLLALVFAVPVAGLLLFAALAYPLMRPRK